MSDVKLDFETVKKGLAALAEDKPDFIYRAPAGTCYYNTYEGDTPFAKSYSTDTFGDANPITGPGCGIGALLLEAGVPAEELREFDRKADSAADLPFWADDDAKKLAQAFQGHQDLGTPWAFALHVALEDFEAGIDV